MKLQELLAKSRPWSLEVHFGKNEWDTEIFADGERLEDVRGVKVEVAIGDKPKIQLLFYKFDRTETGLAIGYPMEVSLESDFTGVLKGEATR